LCLLLCECVCAETFGTQQHELKPFVIVLFEVGAGGVQKHLSFFTRGTVTAAKV